MDTQRYVNLRWDVQSETELAHSIVISKMLARFPLFCSIFADRRLQDFNMLVWVLIIES